MKRIILTLTIAILVIVSFGQDTTVFIPNYGIEIDGYEETQKFKTDTFNLRYDIKFMSPIFEEKKVIFVYDVKSYSDMIMKEHIKNKRIELPLNAIISGKKVYEWLNDLYSVQDTAILKGLSEKLYYYDLMQK